MSLPPLAKYQLLWCIPCYGFTTYDNVLLVSTRTDPSALFSVFVDGQSALLLFANS